MKGSRFAPVAVVLVILLALSAGLSVAQGPAPQGQGSPQAEVSPAFTYQGQLLKDGNLVDDTCTMVFSLYDDVSAGTQVGGPLTQTVAITDGLFTVPLDFWYFVFTGDARWLEIAVQCTGDAGFNILAPRQELTAVPYALSLQPGARVTGSVGGAVVHLTNTSNNIDSIGVEGQSESTQRGVGVFGWASATSGESRGVWGTANSSEGAGVYGQANATSGTTYGVWGEAAAPNGRGVYGYASATSGNTRGVLGLIESSNGVAVYGSAIATGGWASGVYGETASTAGRGVEGYASASSGETRGVYGHADSTEGYGVYGRVSAASGLTFGVYGTVVSPYGYAGYFSGRVHVTDDLTVGGAKSFLIDHPLDPANQYLYHYSVESSEVLNQYSGNAVLDAGGSAWVDLPTWFSAINQDIRYQLTPVGGAAPGLYIAQEVRDNRFQIAGGPPGLKVSWEITAVRNDPYIQRYGAPVEVEKPATERGTYLHPELYSQPEELGLEYRSTPDRPDADLVPDTTP